MHVSVTSNNFKFKALLDIVCKGWQYPVLRDEIFLQLVKQTTHNPSTTSLQLGWELMAICLKIFPPSTQLLHLLEIYIRRHRKFGNKDIAVYADVCLERLIKMSSSGPRRGVQKPTIEEIQNAMNTILSPSMFGTSLIELMEMQRSIPNYTHLNLPWIQIALSSTILQLGGVTTEGIFRIPGDVDKVNCLKAKCNQWTIPIQQIVEPHVPASLLKLWYRELADPLIPDWLYADCISATTADQCVQITDKLPTIHRNVMIYLVQFLQLFALPKHVAYTKMDVNNLALVMAPNCFRCRCNNPRDIVENSKKEMQFLRMLITNWRTSHPGQLNFNVNQNKQHDLQNGMDNDGGDKEKDEFESSSNDSFMCSL
ncbi:hypothetical protein GJ496_002581 [Pomphorhynchus laevis]|nr:hypothetical protein GJ496_002581 [Pomphorhynchus laevis]